MQNLLKDVAIDRVENAAAAGTTDVESDSVDMAGYDGVTLIAALGTLTASQVTKLKAQGSDDDSSFSDLTGAVTDAMADGDSNKLLVVDVYRPLDRYVRAVLDRGTQNAVLDGIIAIRYRGRVSPVTQGTSVSKSALAVSV